MKCLSEQAYQEISQGNAKCFQKGIALAVNQDYENLIESMLGGEGGRDNYSLLFTGFKDLCV